jgi:Rieske Fe-S protein
MTDRSELTRRELMCRAALTCAPLAVAGCARFVSTERTIAAAAPVDGNVLLPLSSAPELARAGGAVVVRPAGSSAFLVVNSGTGLFALRAECPHAGCILTWVPEDREAECPCHGSRFAGDGTVLHPPANSDIARYPVDGPDAQGNAVLRLFAGDGVFRQPVSGGSFSFAIADYPALQSVGGAVLGRPEGFPSPLLVTRIAAAGTDAVAAVSAVCSHLGCTVLPSACAPAPGCTAGSFLQCPCHGSEYDLTGAFLRGPAGTGLLRFGASFDGATVTVSTQPRA